MKQSALPPPRLLVKERSQRAVSGEEPGGSGGGSLLKVSESIIHLTNIYGRRYSWTSVFVEVPTTIVESSRTCPQLMVSKDLLPLFQRSYCKQGPFHGLLGAMFFTFLCFWLVILLLKMTPEHKMLFCEIGRASCRERV